MTTLEVIEIFKGEEYPIQADFRPKCKRIGTSISSAVHAAETSGIITIGASSVAGNVASVVITANTKGCTVLKSTGTTSEGYDLIGKCEIHVIDPIECAG